MSADPKHPRSLMEHPALRWPILGRTVECVEIGLPDEVIIVFDDGSELRITPASVSADFRDR
jgi:hypothetical protein